MLDEFDYKEPACLLCGGEDFYYPKKGAPKGHIPIDRIIAKVDECFNCNNLEEAGRLLEYWKDEAVNLNDTHGELSICSELCGYYRKTMNKDKALPCIDRSIQLVEALNQADSVSGATIILNCATTLKAFGLSEKSMTLFENVEAVYSKHLKPTDAKYAGLYNNMALTLVDLNRFDEAKKAYGKAIDIMIKIEQGKADAAVSYVNLAYMFEKLFNKAKSKECLQKAYELLSDKELVHNGYYAFVCEKCAPAFEYFGLKSESDELKKLAGEIYARS